MDSGKVIIYSFTIFSCMIGLGQKIHGFASAEACDVPTLSVGRCTSKFLLLVQIGESRDDLRSLVSSSDILAGMIQL